MFVVATNSLRILYSLIKYNRFRAINRELIQNAKQQELSRFISGLARVSFSKDRALTGNTKNKKECLRYEF